MTALLTKGLAALCRADPVVSDLVLPRLPEITLLLDAYITEIETFNPVYGLVKVSGREELVVKHILDSLAALGCIARLLQAPARPAAGSPPARPAAAGPVNSPARLADAGSGAGLPGIPLAICLPGAEVTLIERMTGRADFLRNAAAVLGLANVAIAETEMEKAPGGYTAAVFRAFRPLEPRILKGLFRLLAPGGYLAAYKGKLENIERETAWMGSSALFPAGFSPEIHRLRVPFLDEERHLVIIQEASPATAPKIPRPCLGQAHG
ncbi:MAG: 16S rRNA (guanine(527)-N(7))-methyltransferase RsmG [Treponema sp.]|jgi:16S rRNA (guanine527-N7)-methyltransferase|nr:16S rRNA (guanine(527)-N(7))-methyltransferase RsmG [Treponema sp.]